MEKNHYIHLFKLHRILIALGSTNGTSLISEKAAGQNSGIFRKTCPGKRLYMVAVLNPE